MRPAPLDYLRPGSRGEACRALADGGTALAGGQSLLPLLKLRVVRPTLLVDLNRIPDLRGVSADPAGAVTLGAMTRHQQIADDPLIRAGAPALADAAARTGDRQVRVRGTVGGNVCFADPRANLSTALVALGATAVLERAGGERRVPVADLFADARATALEPGELLTRFGLAAQPDARASVYLEIAPQPNGVPIVNVAVVPGSDGTGPRIAVGGLLRTPARALAVEEEIAAHGPLRPAIAHGVSRMVSEHRPYDDARGDAAYRSRIAAVLIDRALRRAEQRQSGQRRAEQEG